MKDVELHKSDDQSKHCDQSVEPSPLSSENPAAENTHDVKKSDLCKKQSDILVVEDSPITQMFLKKILIQFGHNVSVASDGIEALDKIKHQCFDLVFMDLEMPLLDGLSTMQKIKTLFDSHPSVIAVTAASSQKEIDRCYQAGTIDYIAKPFNIKMIESALER